MRLRIWLMAARPRTLPAAIAPVLVGGRGAVCIEAPMLVGCRRPGPRLPLGAFVAALVGSIFIQIGTNLANDYSDAKRGADTVDRLGPGPGDRRGPGRPAPRAGRHLGRVRGRGRLRHLPGDGGRAGHPRRRRRLDPRRRPLHRRPPALRLRRPRRAVRLPLLRPRRRQRLLLRAARGARLAAVRALDLGRRALDRDPRRQQRPRHRHRPPRRQEHARGPAGPRAGPAPLRGADGARLRRPARHPAVADDDRAAGGRCSGYALAAAGDAGRPARC